MSGIKCNPETVRTCPKCSAVHLHSEWPRYAGNGRLTVQCANCNAEIERRRKATADAIARGYRSAQHTPEHKRAQRETWAAKAGRELPTYTPQVERERMSAMLKAEREADRIRSRVVCAFARDLAACWRREYPEVSTFEEMRKAAEQVKAAYWANPAKARQYRRLYKASNPDKVAAHCGNRGARMLNTSDGTLTVNTLGRMFDKETECPYCSKPMATDADKSLDHFIPLVLGGRHSVANVLICCRACNFEKNRTHPMIWLGAEMFESLLSKLRARCAGEPCEVGGAYPRTQVAA